MSGELLIADIRALLAESQERGEVEAEALAGAARRTAAEAETLTPAQGREASALLGALIEQAQHQQVALREQLRDVGTGRRAIKGYGAWEGPQKMQRVSKRV